MPNARRRPSSATAEVRTYVLDTSVLLSDPHALFRFAEHEVVVPVVVVVELEAKRSHPELGYFARNALRLLDDLRVSTAASTTRCPSASTAARCASSSTTPTPPCCPTGSSSATTTPASSPWRATSPPTAATSCSSARTCRCASRPPSVGLAAEEYRAELVVESGWTGMTEIDVPGSRRRPALRGGPHRPRGRRATSRATPGLVLVSERGSALGRVTADKQVRLVRGDREAFGLHGRSAEQRVALDLLLDPEVGIVSLGGRAGTGKSALALCAGLEAVLERRQHRKVIVFRPLYAVGGQELGYLPGSESEKMSPWGQAVFDTLGALTTQEVVEEIVDRGMLEVLPLTHIRGRSLHDAFVIVDEAQSLERNVLLTVLSRIGRDSRVVLTHDVAQRDNLRVGRHDGIVAVIEKLKGHPLFAHVTLTRSERSPIAALVTEMLEDLPV